jgi:pyruvate formate lyase activating enzyme
MSDDIYLRYTKKDNKSVVDNLKFIASKGLQDRCLIKIPSIPKYNTQNDIAISKNIILSMGYQNIILFDYVIRKPHD